MKMGSPEGILRYWYIAGAVCMATPVFSNNQTIVMISFCCFEFICGIYFPGMGVMRSQYIPEEVRATVMNLIRIGLNFIVVVVLNSIE